MLRQSSSRNYRSKKLRPRHTFQAVLLFAVGFWVVYQLSRSHGKRRAVVVEITDDGDGLDGEAARRRLGRKGLPGFTGHASSDDDGIVGVGSQAAGWGAASSDDDPSSMAEDGERDSDGDEEDIAVDEDDHDGGDDADDGLAGHEQEQDDDDGDRDLLSQIGNTEDELDTVFGEGDRATVSGNGDGDDGTLLIREPKELNSSNAVPRVKAAGSVQDAAASQKTNATDGAADGRASAMALSDASLKNDSSASLSVHGFVLGGAGADNESHNVSVEVARLINHNESAGSVAGHGISS